MFTTGITLPNTNEIISGFGLENLTPGDSKYVKFIMDNNGYEVRITNSKISDKWKASHKKAMIRIMIPKASLFGKAVVKGNTSNPY